MLFKQQEGDLNCRKQKLFHIPRQEINQKKFKLFKHEKHNSYKEKKKRANLPFYVVPDHGERRKRSWQSSKLHIKWEGVLQILSHDGFDPWVHRMVRIWIECGLDGLIALPSTDKMCCVVRISRNQVPRVWKGKIKFHLSWYANSFFTQ